jgi:hypothetical protein
MQQYLADIVAYFKYLCTQHPLLLHTDATGDRIFEVRDLEDAFGSLRSTARAKSYVVRFVFPTMGLTRDHDGARKSYELGLLILKWHGKKESEDADVVAAMSAAETVADDIIERIVTDSRQGYGLFEYGIDNPDNLNLQGEFIQRSLDGSYSGVLYMFRFDTPRKLSSLSATDCAAVEWLDGGVTP